MDSRGRLRKRSSVSCVLLLDLAAARMSARLGVELSSRVSPRFDYLQEQVTRMQKSTARLMVRGVSAVNRPMEPSTIAAQRGLSLVGHLRVEDTHCWT